MNKITDAQFEELIINAKGKVMLKFGAPWCKPCDALDVILKDIETRVSAKIYEMDVTKNQIIPQNYMIMSVPAVMVFENGQPIKNRVGLADKRYYEEMLEDDN